MSRAHRTLVAGVAICGVAVIVFTSHRPQTSTLRGSEYTENNGRTDQCELVGTWSASSGATVDVAPDGFWKLRNGADTVMGTWKAYDGRLMLTDKSTDGAGPICPSEQVGTYKFQIQTRPCTLKLGLIEDPCAIRGHTLRRAVLSRSVVETSALDHGAIAKAGKGFR
ncbi:MAG TPA: hypothetical protein VHC69_29130 [Polyangiaceae bacterium]|nr:hypothetical protein [Polyangiaceae bacterium]